MNVAEDVAEDVMVRVVDDDRELLHALGLNYSEAAMYLGRTRQAVQSKLASPDPPRDYFTLGEIVLLVSAARSLGRDLDLAKISDIVEYVSRSRHDAPPGPYRLFVQLLQAGAKTVDVGDAAGIVFLLPGFAELRRTRPEVTDSLLDLIDGLPKDSSRPSLFVLSTTRTQAALAARWLGIDNEHNCFGNDLVDHYGPTIVVYRRGHRAELDTALPYILTDRGTFEASPRFRHDMIADCVCMMLPAEIARILRPGGVTATA